MRSDKEIIHRLEKENQLIRAEIERLSSKLEHYRKQEQSEREKPELRLKLALLEFDKRLLLD